jgi:hypothetical protein
VTGELTQGAFVIRKIHSAYLVSVLETTVSVKPLPGSKAIAINVTTATTMQMVGNSKLLLHKPQDPCSFLMDYYNSLGWSIEVAD